MKFTEVDIKSFTKEHENDKSAKVRIETSYATILSQWSFFNVNKMRDIKDIPAAELKFTYGCVFDSLL